MSDIKSKTGMYETLGKVFGSSEMEDTVKRMNRLGGGPQPVDIRPSDPQTDTPSDGESVKPPDAMTVTASNTPTVELSNGNTVEQSEPRTVAPSKPMRVKRSDSRTDIPLDDPTVSPSEPQTVTASDAPTDRPSQTQTVNFQRVPVDVLMLPYNQAAVLEFLIKAGGLTNYRTISDHTKVSPPSVRDAVARLVRRGFMHEPVVVRTATYQGFSYVLNAHMCDHFMYIGGLERSAYQTVRQYDTRPSDGTYLDPQTVSPSGSQTPFSSSILSTKELTTKTPQTVSLSDPQTLRPPDIFILSGPTGMFWEEEGLQEGQAQTWCSQFDITPEQLKSQLEWARYDLVTNGRRGEVKKDCVSWFFGCLRRTGGCYPRPANYKSPSELRIEEMQKEANELKAAREKHLQAELDYKFEQIMANPQGAEYLQLLAKASQFAKEMGGYALETELKQIFQHGASAL